MKLIFFRGDTPNFGDELNLYIWDRLLPRDFLDSRTDEIFLGIGSIIWDTLSGQATKYVVGSGYGGYTDPPNVKDGTWRVIFVRGPRTARALGLPPETAITDAAVLLRKVALPPPAPNIGIAFIPHWESHDRGRWQMVCRLAGVRYLDPGAPVEQLLGEIQGAKLIITEAMHGAIVADALRVPWVAVKPFSSQHHFKWLDWADSLQITLRPRRLFPSSVRELMLLLPKRVEAQAWRRVAHKRIGRLADGLLVPLAALTLFRLRFVASQQSDSTIIDAAADNAYLALMNFVKEKGRKSLQ